MSTPSEIILQQLMNQILQYFISRFGGVEDEFEEFAKTQNTSVEKMLALVKENEEILDLMRVSCTCH